MSKRQDLSDQWRVKLENGQIKGPFPIESIKKMIIEGILSGQEEVSRVTKFQNGDFEYSDWQILTKQPEFYEALLESLENPQQRDEKKVAQMEAETVIQKRTEEELANESAEDDEILNLVKTNTSGSSDQSTKIDMSLSSDLQRLSADKAEAKKNNDLNATANYENLQLQASENLIKARDQQLTLEMKNFKELQKLNLKKLTPHLLILGVVIVLASTLIYILNLNQEEEIGWRLIAPSAQALKEANLKPALAPDQLKTLKSKAIQLIRQGELESTRDAQKYLVQAIEGNPQDIENMGLLCVVYEQIWPFTKQTAQDYKALTTVTQLSRSLNPLSNYAETCQAVYLLIKGQPKEANGLIEKILNEKSKEVFILTPFLYHMKGQLFEEVKNYINAEAFYGESVVTFPDWKWALFSLARSQYKQDKFQESKMNFEKLLKLKSDYKPALFGVGLTESKIQSASNTFKEQVLNYFDQGFAVNSYLPKTFHIESLLEYIQLLLKKGDRKKALDVAQFGLVVSPTNKALKDTVIALGGEEKFNNASSELVFLGDQFVRTGDYLAAQAQYKAAFEFDSKNAQIALKVAKSLWQLRQSREALSWVEKAIKIDQKLAQAYSIKADYLSQKFNFTEASKVLQEALKNVGQSYEIYKAQAQVEFRKNSMATAITYAEKGYRLYDADVELLSLLANANINLYLNTPSRSGEEEALKTKFLESAQLYASRAVDLEPGWPEAQITYSRYLYIKPNSNSQGVGGGSYSAETNFKKLIETFPYTFEYRIGLAEFYELLEKYTLASEIYNQLVIQDPKNKKALMGYGRMRQLLFDYAEAKKYYLLAAVLDPSDVEPLFLTAQIELENSSKGDLASIKSAYKKFDAVKSVNPNYPRISYFLAKCHFEIGEFDQAISFLNEEKKRNPGLTESYVLAAQVYVAKGQFRDCAAEYSQAIKLRPYLTDLYISASICYRKSDALDIASDMLTIAYERESGKAEIYREQGYLLEASGQLNEARKKFLRYLDLSPNAEDKKIIEQKIGL